MTVIPFQKLVCQQPVSKFNGKMASLQETLTIKSVLDHLAQGQGWNAAHEAVLASATADDFYGIFKAITGKTLHSYVDASLMFGRLANATERQIAITDKAKEALRKIGSESLLNKIRVGRYGVYFEEPPH